MKDMNVNNVCTKEDFDIIAEEYDDIADNLQIKNGIISFTIDYKTFVDAGYPENSRMFLTRDAHTWNDYKSKDYYRSKTVFIRISKPPRFKGAYNLYIKKDESWTGIDINPLNTIDDVVNALNRRIMMTLKM